MDEAQKLALKQPARAALDFGVLIVAIASLPVLCCIVCSKAEPNPQVAGQAHWLIPACVQAVTGPMVSNGVTQERTLQKYRPGKVSAVSRMNLVCGLYGEINLLRDAQSKQILLCFLLLHKLMPSIVMCIS